MEFSSLRRVVRPNHSSRRAFLRRIFDTRIENDDPVEWDSTNGAMGDAEILEAFRGARKKLARFIANPSLRNFESWQEKWTDALHEMGSYDDFKISPMYLAFLNTAHEHLDTDKYEHRGIEPLHSHSDITDEEFYELERGDARELVFTCSRKFVTFALALAQAGGPGKTPHLQEVAEELLTESLQRNHQPASIGAEDAPLQAAAAA
jgi:hypothetical protein